MVCYQIPFVSSSAAANMATDFALLVSFPMASAWRWRWYAWQQQPAFTFGYRQPYEAVMDWIHTQTPATASADICRRPTGGGIVDHRNDITLAVVIPPSHALFSVTPLDAYKAVHDALATALRAAGQDCVLQPCGGPGCSTRPAAANQCFQQAEPGDIVARRGGHKLLGSAMKRTREGLLLQSSLSVAACQSPFNASTYRAEADLNLTALAGAQTLEPYPALLDSTELHQAFASKDWILHRKLKS